MEHQGPIWSLDWHCGGQCLATAGVDRLVRLCNVELLSKDGHNKSVCQTVLRGHKGSVNSARFVTNGHILVTASADKTVALWDTRSVRFQFYFIN